WYFGVLSVLPQARESLSLPFGTYINNRGFFFPAFVWGEGSGFIGIAFMVGIVATFLIALWSRRRRMATGQALHTVRWAFALLFGLPLITLIATGLPVSFDFPELGTFNLTGGSQIKPEFLALLLALSFYTAAFIAEIVRA